MLEIEVPCCVSFPMSNPFSELMMYHDKNFDILNVSCAEIVLSTFCSSILTLMSPICPFKYIWGNFVQWRLNLTEYTLASTPQVCENAQILIFSSLKYTVNWALCWNDFCWHLALCWLRIFDFWIPWYVKTIAPYVASQRYTFCAVRFLQKYA